jgi:hypothetical protein
VSGKPGQTGLDVKLLVAVKSEASETRAADSTTGGPGVRIHVGRRWVYRFPEGGRAASGDRGVAVGW